MYVTPQLFLNEMVFFYKLEFITAFYFAAGVSIDCDEALFILVNVYSEVKA